MYREVPSKRGVIHKMPIHYLGRWVGGWVDGRPTEEKLLYREVAPKRGVIHEMPIHYVGRWVGGWIEDLPKRNFWMER